MPRIQPVAPDTADPATVELLNSVRKSKGAVPNRIATMANSPVVARTYLGFAQALAGCSGSLLLRLREQIAGMALAMEWATQGLVIPHVSQTIDSTVETINAGLQMLKAGRCILGKVAAIVDRDLAAGK